MDKIRNTLNFKATGNNLEEFSVDKLTDILNGKVKLQLYTITDGSNLKQSEDYSVDLKDLIDFLGGNLNLSSNNTVFDKNKDYSLTGEINLSNLKLSNNRLTYTDGTVIKTLQLNNLVTSTEPVHFTGDVEVNKLKIDSNSIQFIDSNNQTQSLNLENLNSGWVTKLEFNSLSNKVSAAKTVNNSQGNDINYLKVELNNVKSHISSIFTSTPFHPEDDIHFTGDETKVDNLVVNDNKIKYVDNGVENTLGFNTIVNSIVNISQDVSDIKDVNDAQYLDIHTLKQKVSQLSTTKIQADQDLYFTGIVAVEDLALTKSTLTYVDNISQSIKTFDFRSVGSQALTLSSINSTLNKLNTYNSIQDGRLENLEVYALVKDLNITSINSTLTKFRSDIKQLKPLLTTVPTIQSSVNTLTGNLSTINLTLGSLDTRIDSTETDITIIEDEIITIKSEIIDIENSLASIPDTIYAELIRVEENMNSLDERVTIQESGLQTLQTDFNGYKVSNNNKVTSLDDRITTLEHNGTSTGTIITGITTAEFQILKNRVSAEKTINQTQDNQIAGLTVTVNSNKATINTLKTDMTTNKNNIVSLGGRITVLENKKFVTGSTITTIKLNISDIEQDISLINNTLQSEVNRNDTQDTQIQILKNKVSVIGTVGINPDSDFEFRGNVNLAGQETKITNLQISKPTIQYKISGTTTLQTLDLSGLSSSSDVSAIKLDVIHLKANEFNQANNYTMTGDFGINNLLIKASAIRWVDRGSVIHTFTFGGAEFNSSNPYHWTARQLNNEIIVKDLIIADSETTPTKGFRFITTNATGIETVDLHILSSDNIRNLDSKLNSIKSAISSIKTVNTNQDSKLTTIENKVSANTTVITSVKSTLTKINSTISSLRHQGISQFDKNQDYHNGSMFMIGGVSHIVIGGDTSYTTKVDFSTTPDFIQYDGTNDDYYTQTLGSGWEDFRTKAIPLHLYQEGIYKPVESGVNLIQYYPSFFTNCDGGVVSNYNNGRKKFIDKFLPFLKSGSNYHSFNVPQGFGIVNNQSNIGHVTGGLPTRLASIMLVSSSHTSRTSLENGHIRFPDSRHIDKFEIGHINDNSLAATQIYWGKQDGVTENINYQPLANDQTKYKTEINISPFAELTLNKLVQPVSSDNGTYKEVDETYTTTTSPNKGAGLQLGFYTLLKQL